MTIAATVVETRRYQVRIAASNSERIGVRAYVHLRVTPRRRSALNQCMDLGFLPKFGEFEEETAWSAVKDLLPQQRSEWPTVPDCSTMPSIDWQSNRIGSVLRNGLLRRRFSQGYDDRPKQAFTPFAGQNGAGVFNGMTLAGKGADHTLPLPSAISCRECCADSARPTVFSSFRSA